VKVPPHFRSWERKFQGTKVPGNESSWERKFQRTKVPESVYLGAKVRENESSCYHPNPVPDHRDVPEWRTFEIVS